MCNPLEAISQIEGRSLQRFLQGLPPEKRRTQKPRKPTFSSPFTSGLKHRRPKETFMRLLLGEVGGEHGSASHGKEGVAFADARELENNGGIEPTFSGFYEKRFQRIFVRHCSTGGAVGGQHLVDGPDLQGVVF